MVSPAGHPLKHQLPPFPPDLLHAPREWQVSWFRVSLRRSRVAFGIVSFFMCISGICALDISSMRRGCGGGVRGCPSKKSCLPRGWIEKGGRASHTEIFGSGVSESRLQHSQKQAALSDASSAGMKRQSTSAGQNLFHLWRSRHFRHIAESGAQKTTPGGQMEASRPESERKAASPAQTRIMRRFQVAPPCIRHCSVARGVVVRRMPEGGRDFTARERDRAF